MSCWQLVMARASRLARAVRSDEPDCKVLSRNYYPDVSRCSCEMHDIIGGKFPAHV